MLLIFRLDCLLLRQVIDFKAIEIVSKLNYVKFPLHETSLISDLHFPHDGPWVRAHVIKR